MYDKTSNLESVNEARKELRILSEIEQWKQFHQHKILYSYCSTVDELPKYNKLAFGAQTIAIYVAQQELPSPEEYDWKLSKEFKYKWYPVWISNSKCQP